MRKKTQKKAALPLKKSLRKTSLSVKKTIKKAVKKVSLKRPRLGAWQAGFAVHEIVVETPAAYDSQPPAPDTRLPSRYGEDRMVLLVRDPWWLFTYWEVTPEREMEVRRAMEREGLSKEQAVLRAYDITDTDMSKPNSFFDVELRAAVDNWYLDVGVPDRQWVLEMGIRTSGGRFFALVRSNAVRTPRFGLSNILDEEWMLPEDIYFKLFGLATGYQGQGGSFDIKKMLDKYFKGVVSSENSPELAGKPGKKP